MKNEGIIQWIVDKKINEIVYKRGQGFLFPKKSYEKIIKWKKNRKEKSGGITINIR